jgi:hypothetical protein
MRARFIKVTRVSMVPQHDRGEPFGTFFGKLTRYREEAQGPVFINRDCINAVELVEYLGAGKRTTIDVDYFDSCLTVKESLEEVMRQIEEDT